MPTEIMIREYLLGMSDSEAEKTIEEGILSGSPAAEDLMLAEEDLIDDHVFGRLSAEEEAAFQANFCLSPERQTQLAFSRAMQKYILRKAPARPRLSFSIGALPRFALAASFALLCVVAAGAAWLEIRNVRLGKELAGVSRTSDEQQRLLALLMEQEKQRAAQTGPAGTVAGGAAAPGAAVSTPEVTPGIHLRPGVKRGIEPIPVLRVAGEAGAVRITLDLAFEPGDGLREELFHAGGARIWDQELSSARPVVAHGSTTVYVPSQLLSPGDYQIRVKDLSGDASDEGDVYVFRVSR